MMAERARRTAGSDSIGTLSGPPLLVVLVIMAPAGMGKTQGYGRRFGVSSFAKTIAWTYHEPIPDSSQAASQYTGSMRCVPRGPF
jgi:hypothetical protein